MSRRLYLLLLYLLLVCSTAFLCLCLSACATRETYYSHFEMIEEGTWHADEELFFSFSQPPKSTSTSSLAITIVLRVEKGIRLKALPVGLTLETPSHQYQTLQVQIPLRDQAQEGYHLSEVTYELPRVLQCDEAGFYTISLRHLATQPEVHGVVEVGVLVAWATKTKRK